MAQLVLNVGAGRNISVPFLKDKAHTVINLDQMYEAGLTFKEVEQGFIKGDFERDYNVFLKHDIFDFLERTIMTFDFITVYRFLEHVSKNNVQYFIYLLANCTKVGGVVDIIVPDAKLLAKKLLEEDVNSPNWESDDLLITYELVADQPSPHLSIWTKDRLIKLFEREGNFVTSSVDENFIFDGRDIYLRYLAVRKK